MIDQQEWSTRLDLSVCGACSFLPSTSRNVQQIKKKDLPPSAGGPGAGATSVKAEAAVTVLSAGRRRQVALAFHGGGPQCARDKWSALPAGDASATAARPQPRIVGQQIKARHGRQPAKERSKFPRSPRAPAIIRGPNLLVPLIYCCFG
jgi:hypothetical protein